MNLMAAKMVMMMRIMTMTIATLTNSHLCSFVLTQFCLTHPLAQHIWYSPRAVIILEIPIVVASGVKRSPPEHHPPLSCGRHPLAFFVCRALCDQNLYWIVWWRFCVAEHYARASADQLHCFFHLYIFSLFPEKDGGRSFHELPLAPEMVNTKWGEMVSSSAYLPTTYPQPQPLAWMTTMYNPMPNGYRPWGNKLGRCDSGLQSETINHWLTDFLTERGRC